MAKKKPYLLNEGMFIDPSDDVGSYIVVRVQQPRLDGDNRDYVRFAADVVLADCGNDTVRWHFDADDEGIAKVQRVIEQLQKFQRVLLSAIPLHRELLEEAKAKREARKAAAEHGIVT